MRDINALLQSAPISRIKTLRDDEGRRRGFTLIELLVVVLIISILAAVALPQYQKAVKRATYTRMIPMVQAIANAQKLYYLEHGVYASSFDELDLNIVEDAALTKKKCGKWIESDRRYVDGMCIGLAKNTLAPGSVRVDLPMTADSWNGYGYLLKRYNSKVPEGLVCMEARGGRPRDPHCRGTFLYSDATGYFFAME